MSRADEAASWLASPARSSTGRQDSFLRPELRRSQPSWHRSGTPGGRHPASGSSGGGPGGSCNPGVHNPARAALQDGLPAAHHPVQQQSQQQEEEGSFDKRDRQRSGHGGTADAWEARQQQHHGPPQHHHYAPKQHPQQRRRQQQHRQQPTHAHTKEWVPIKEWSSCREIAEQMSGLPPSRLDQRLLSGALQHMVVVHERCRQPDDHACCRRLVGMALQQVHSFDPFGLCIIVRTAARLKVSLLDSELEAWCSAAQPLLSKFNPQDLTNSLFSIGSMGHRLPPSALPGFCSAVVRLCHRMKPQEQSNTLLGLAYMYGERAKNASPPKAVESAAVAVLQNAQQHLRHFTNQELANLAWGFCKATHEAGRQQCVSALWCLFDEAGPRAAHFKPQEISNLVLAAATTTLLHPWALADLVAAAAGKVSELEEQHLANILRSLALLPHYYCPDNQQQRQQQEQWQGRQEAQQQEEQQQDPAQHGEPEQQGDPVQQQQQQPVQQPVQQQLPAAAAATPPLRQRCVSVADVEVLRDELLLRLKQATIAGGWQPRKTYTPTLMGICHSLWGLAVLQACTKELWQGSMRVVLAWQKADVGGCQAEDLGQLHDAHALLAAEHPEWRLELPAEIKDAAEQAAASYREDLGVVVSSCQRQVSRVLQAAGVPHELECSCQGEGGHSIDLALPQDRIAIEVDGPHHFSVNAVCGRHWPLGRTEARDRLLAARDWQVVQVNTSTWSKLPPAERPVWLLRQLRLNTVSRAEARCSGQTCLDPETAEAQQQLPDCGTADCLHRHSGLELSEEPEY